jgi:hypothetical protein
VEKFSGSHKLNIGLSYDQAIPLQLIESRVLNRYLYTNFYRGIIHRHQKKTQMPIYK